MPLDLSSTMIMGVVTSGQPSVGDNEEDSSITGSIPWGAKQHLVSLSLSLSLNIKNKKGEQEKEEERARKERPE